MVSKRSRKATRETFLANSKHRGSPRMRLRFVAASRWSVGDPLGVARVVAKGVSLAKRRKLSCGQIPRMGHRMWDSRSQRKQERSKEFPQGG